MERNQLQKKWKELVVQQPLSILQVATGVGKSLTALQVIKDVGGKWYIVVAETNHIKNWYDEIIKQGLQDLLLNVEIFCYASLHKYQDTEVKGIIFDEGHHIATDKRIQASLKIKTERVIVLTATLSSEIKSILNFYFGDFYEIKYSLSQAISDGILPEPKVFLVGIDLPEEKTEYIIQKGKDRVVMHCHYEE